MSIDDIKTAEHGPHIWEAPLPILTDMDTQRPFPMDCLPPTLRGAAQAIASHVKAPPELAAYCVISTVSHLAQARINAPHLLYPDGMPCSLFTLVLADSGDRKSQCDRLAFKEIKSRDAAARREWLKTVASIKASGRGRVVT